jgi:hypothetical protein
MEAAMARTVGEQPSYPTLDSVLEVIAQWVKKYRYAAGLRNEFARCGPEEVAHTASELGLSSRDLFQLASKGPHAADLLQRMLVALGVDPQKLASKDPAVMRDLQRLCILCGEKKRCTHELAAGAASDNYREFCPNAFTLEGLLQGK